MNGYLEWRRPHYVIADGQRVHWDDHTQLTIGHYPDVQSVPLGYEIAVKGYRVADGSLVAEELQAKPNGIAAFENEMRNACDQVEEPDQAGVAFDQDRTGSIYEIGRIETSGPRVSRAESIIGRLLPPYVNPRSVRIYVVDTRVWNASAMANGAVFVYSGLMDDMSDSELAVVLGHELAHYTHEHGRRKQRNSGLVRWLRPPHPWLWTICTKAESRTPSASLQRCPYWHGKTGTVAILKIKRIASVCVMPTSKAGFDINVAPDCWQRVGEHSGDFDVVSNFFLGYYSRSADRKRNAERELRLNYSPAATSTDSNR